MGEWCGFLNIDKPSGTTSRRVVDQVLRLVRPCKVGHAGTLDPLATGVLVVAIGSATRLVEYLHRESKSYLGTFLLGRSSPTEDVDGEVVELASPPIPDEDQLRRAADALVGTIEQRPPAYSAIHVAGRRAYDLARQGKTLELTPRRVTVHRLDVLRYAYPVFELAVECSSGTYIRSLGRDLAERLGTSAVMSALRRTAIGPFAIGSAVRPEEVSAAGLAALLQPLALGVRSLPQLAVSTAEAAELAHGRPISRQGLAPGEAAATDAQGKLLAIVRLGRGGMLWPKCNIAAAASLPTAADDP